MGMQQLNAMRNAEVIANNVANANTGGFKADKVKFSHYMKADVYDNTSFPKAVTSMSDFSEGPIKTTGRALDVAISGPGFFVIQTPLGLRYTRSGSFRINGEGALVNSSNYKVLSLDGQEIIFEPDDKDPKIGDDGAIGVGNAERGVIGIAEFDNLQMLRKTGNTMFASDVAPRAAETSRVLQGVLEESNVNSVEQIARLSEIQREVTLTTNMINESYSLQRNTFRTYSKNGG